MIYMHADSLLIDRSLRFYYRLLASLNDRIIIEQWFKTAFFFDLLLLVRIVTINFVWRK